MGRRFWCSRLLHVAWRKPVLNSTAIGAYADYLTKESRVVYARISDAGRARAPRLLREILRGYGAIVHGMKYAKHWGAIAQSLG